MHCEAVNYLLETFTKYNIVSEIDDDIVQLTLVWNKFPMEFAEVLWIRALRRDKVYDEYVLKGIFIEALAEPVCHSMHSQWGSKIIAAVHELASQGTLLAQLHHGSRSTNASRHHDKMDSRHKNPGHKGRKVNHCNSNLSSSLKLPHKNASSSRSRLPPTAMPILATAGATHIGIMFTTIVNEINR